MTAADLLGAACELQALLSHRAALGLGPLLHAQPYFPTDSAPGDERHLGHTVPFSGPATPVLQVDTLMSHQEVFGILQLITLTVEPLTMPLRNLGSRNAAHLRKRRHLQGKAAAQLEIMQSLVHSVQSGLM